MKLKVDDSKKEAECRESERYLKGNCISCILIIGCLLMPLPFILYLMQNPEKACAGLSSVNRFGNREVIIGQGPLIQISTENDDGDTVTRYFCSMLNDIPYAALEIAELYNYWQNGGVRDHLRNSSHTFSWIHFGNSFIALQIKDLFHSSAAAGKFALLPYLFRNSIYSVCLIKPVLIMIVWKHCRSMAHNFTFVRAGKKNTHD